MKISLAQNTPSQTRQMLKPCQQGCLSALSAEEIIKIFKERKFKDKSGNDIASFLDDMKTKQEALLICNMATDEQNSPINKYLLENHSDRLAEGVRVIAKAGGCREVMIYAPKELDIESYNFV